MSIFLQIDSVATAANQAVETIATKKELTLMEIIFSGGIVGQIVMTSIFIMLFLPELHCLLISFILSQTRRTDVSSPEVVRTREISFHVESVMMTCSSMLVSWLVCM